MDDLRTIINLVIALSGWLTSLYLSRRNRRAEVGAKEATTADQMVDLVKKTFNEVLTITEKENEKLRKSIARLERALRAISLCPYRNTCPVSAGLQDGRYSDEQRAATDDDGQPAHCRNPTGHSGAG